ncbi:two-component system, OmpR family, sensor histidine kinase TctE [Noviherbaspirillum humi]|uniref:histidine kinase n=1 Tax=Noviherbaspirillum humi TaxID=1688639 RepID=A0A239JN37_9BURK|nr:sensor histidine kinase [Noviherbaspirillum humi]SNT07225.1 two-component system, OmpR family, sensor histidine kinase TctE [Noviherbaspirillum humi]
MTRSIRVKLLKWLIVPLLAVNLIGAMLSYWLAWTPAQTALDQSLADAAWAVLPHLRARGDQLEINLSEQAEQVLRVDHFDKVYLVVRDAAGHTLSGDRDFPALSLPTELGKPLAYDGLMRSEPVRIVSLKADIGREQVIIGVAETLRKRNLIRAEILIGLLVLGSALAILSVWVAWFTVSHGLSPLRNIAAKLRARAGDDLSTIDEEQVPTEVQPVIHAMNHVLDRARTGNQARQDFLADVAHQLRTPLAGLNTQLAWLKQNPDAAPQAAQSLQMMSSSVERMIRQTNQLLALARAEPSQYEKQRLELVALDTIVAESVQHFVQEADKKQIDIGFNLQSTTILGDRFLLRDLVDNLIDNAIRYSPPGAEVTASCYPGNGVGVFHIEDNGPGIAAAHLDRIFDRFYRIDEHSTGSGLGLAIVRDIVTDHGARLSLRQRAQGSGTVIEVVFPVKSPDAVTAPAEA